MAQSDDVFPCGKPKQRKRWWQRVAKFFEAETVVSVGPSPCGKCRIVTNKGEYRGRCTVWDHYPSGRMCGTMKRSYLYSVWREYKWSKTG